MAACRKSNYSVQKFDSYFLHAIIKLSSQGRPLFDNSIPRSQPLGGLRTQPGLARADGKRERQTERTENERRTKVGRRCYQHPGPWHSPEWRVNAMATSTQS